MDSWDAIPHELRSLPQWVVWKSENRGDGKPTKVPYSPLQRNLADVNFSQHWSHFETAVYSCGQYGFDGIGFVLTEKDPYCFIDLDPTDDPAIVAKQTQLFYDAKSYSELSPSGKGLHIICKASVLAGRKRDKIEVYSKSRYMTMTGKRYGHHADIADAQDVVTKLWENLASPSNAGGYAVDPDFELKSDRTDFEIYEIAAGARNGEKFLRLWNGDIHTYHDSDHSRADFALIDIIGFYTQEREQIKRLFRYSALGQRKKASREDYLDSMITRSFDNRSPEVDITGVLNQVKLFNATKGIRTVEIEGKEKYIEQFAPVAEPIPIFDPTQHMPASLSDSVFSVPPGLTGMIAKFIYDQSYKPVPEIAITAAIGLMAGICGRSYNVSTTGLNQYLLLLAETGRGKEEMARGIGKLINSAQQMMPTIGAFLGPSDLASGQGLLRHMSEHSTKSFVSVFGEFGLKIRQLSSPRNTGAEEMLKRVLLDFYSKSGASDLIGPTAYSDAEKNTKTIYSPAFSILGESNPSILYTSIDESFIASGLLPRFLTVEYLGLRPPSQFQASAVIPSTELLQQLCTLATQSMKHIQMMQPYDVVFNEASWTANVIFDRECDGYINQFGLSPVKELWNRVHLKVIKLAALLAVGNNPYTPVIDVECFEWARKFVIHSTEKLAAKFENNEVGNANAPTDEVILMDKLRDIIREYVNSDPADLRFKTPIALHRQKVITYSYIQRACNRNKDFRHARYGLTAALKITLQNLFDAGDLQEVPKAQLKRDFGFNGRAFVVRCIDLLAH